VDKWSSKWSKILDPETGKMLSKKLLVKTDSNADNYDVPEKMRNLTEEDFLGKARAGRRRHSVQLDKRVTQQFLENGKLDRRSSNASSYSKSEDSLCKCCVLISVPPLPYKTLLLIYKKNSYLVEIFKRISPNKRMHCFVGNVS